MNGVTLDTEFVVFTQAGCRYSRQFRQVFENDLKASLLYPVRFLTHEETHRAFNEYLAERRTPQVRYMGHLSQSKFQRPIALDIRACNHGQKAMAILISMRAMKHRMLLSCDSDWINVYNELGQMNLYKDYCNPLRKRSEVKIDLSSELYDGMRGKHSNAYSVCTNPHCMNPTCPLKIGNQHTAGDPLPCGSVILVTADMRINKSLPPELALSGDLSLHAIYLNCKDDKWVDLGQQYNSTMEINQREFERSDPLNAFLEYVYILQRHPTWKTTQQKLLTDGITPVISIHISNITAIQHIISYLTFNML
jgi:hypothetical protein